MRAPRFLSAVWLLAAILPLAPLGARAQQAATSFAEGGKISISAQRISYDKKNNMVIARGHVIVKRGDTELRADEIDLNRTTNEAHARGNVVVSDPNGTIVARSIALNLDDETGFLRDAEVQSTRYRYSLWGRRIEKGLGQSYHIENGRFTTCQCAQGQPSWSISGKDLDVDLGGYGRLRGGTFDVLGVPILYVPRAIFPVQRKRQSGFLMPRFGVSNVRGFQTVLPFYWAIDKSQDASVALDTETSARVGLIGEYRYALSREARGLIDASYFNESFRGATTVKPFEQTVPENRWSVAAENTQPFVGDSQAYADGLLVSDDLFLRDINTYAIEHLRYVAIRTLPFTESHLGVVRLWNRIGIKGEGTYYQNLEGTESQTLQRAPEIDLQGQTLLGKHLLGGLTASAVDFQRGSGADGFRFDLQPRVMLPLPLGRFAFGAVHASVRETAYSLTDGTLVDSGQHVARDQSRETVELGGEVGTVFDRIYSIHSLGLEKLKHTLEPQLSYLYIPAVSQGDIPIFDGVDRVNHRNLITYGVVSRFLGKFSAGSDAAASQVANDQSNSIRELARFSLMQSVDISRQINPLQTDQAASHFSDIDFDGRVNPSQALSVRFHTNYDTGNNNIAAARVGLFVEDPRDLRRSSSSGPRLDTRTSAGVSYRFLTQNLLQEVDDNIVIHLTDWAGFLYSSRYDVVADRFLDNFFGLRLISLCDCWALDLAVADQTNPQEVEFRAQLTLAGFGSSSDNSRVAAAP